LPSPAAVRFRKKISDRITAGETITNDDIEFTARTFPKAKLFTSLWNIVNSNAVVIQSDIKKIIASKTREFQSEYPSGPECRCYGVQGDSRQPEGKALRAARI